MDLTKLCFKFHKIFYIYVSLRRLHKFRKYSFYGTHKILPIINDLEGTTQSNFTTRHIYDIAEKKIFPIYFNCRSGTTIQTANPIRWNVKFQTNRSPCRDVWYSTIRLAFRAPRDYLDRCVQSVSGRVKGRTVSTVRQARRSYDERKMEGSEMNICGMHGWQTRMARKSWESEERRKGGKWASVAQLFLASSLSRVMHPIPFPISTFLISNGSSPMAAVGRWKKLNTVTIMFDHYFCH